MTQGQHCSFDVNPSWSQKHFRGSPPLFEIKGHSRCCATKAEMWYLFQSFTHTLGVEWWVQNWAILIQVIYCQALKPAITHIICRNSLLFWKVLLYLAQFSCSQCCYNIRCYYILKMHILSISWPESILNLYNLYAQTQWTFFPPFFFGCQSRVPRLTWQSLPEALSTLVKAGVAFSVLKSTHSDIKERKGKMNVKYGLIFWQTAWIPP